MHKEVDSYLSTSRKIAVERHNAKTHVVPYKPTVGDYVVAACPQGPRTKMSTNWIGPRPVSRILSDFTDELEHLLTATTAVVYVCRIKPYADASVETKAQIKKSLSAPISSGTLWTRSRTSEKQLMASKFSSAGKDLLPLCIPGSRSLSWSKRFLPLFEISSIPPPQPDSSRCSVFHRPLGQP